LNDEEREREKKLRNREFSQKLKENKVLK